MTPLRAVITDIDGTIAETENYHRLAYNALFSHLGLQVRWSEQDYIDRLAVGGGAKFAEILDWLRVPEVERPAKKTELYAWKSRCFEDLVIADVRSGRLPVRPGIVPLFRDILDQGLLLAAASICVKPAAEAILLAALGPDIYAGFTAVCAGEDVSRKKPHPDIYLLAAHRCGVPPAACLAIEDTGHGLAAAKAAGMSCLVAPSAFAVDSDFSSADAAVPSLASPCQLTVADLRRIHAGASPR